MRVVEASLVSAHTPMTDDPITPAPRSDLNAKDFGVVGDGITDDSAALQRFFDACVREGRIGFLENGVYRTTSASLLPPPSE